MNRTFPPEFSALMQQYQATAAGLGDDHPIARRLWLLVEATAPEWFREEMRTIARDMGLIPPPRHCDGDGNPVFALAELAAHLGVTVEEADAAYRKMLADRRALGLPIDGFQTIGEIHTRH